ncbi:MAG: hypothetical protein WDZ54_00515 [Sneathiella sp.]
MENNQLKSIAIYEDSQIFANIAVYSIALQIQRINSDKFEIADFTMQHFVDFHFLITALTQLRNIAETVAEISGIRADIQVFDDDLSDLRHIRNVLEHIDEYRLGRGHNQNIAASSTQTYVFGNNVMHYVGYKIDLDVALKASERLFEAIKKHPPEGHSPSAD